jgi:hypothetical protein
VPGTRDAAIHDLAFAANRASGRNIFLHRLANVEHRLRRANVRDGVEVVNRRWGEREPLERRALPWIVAGRFAVADEIGRILVGWGGIILGAEPVVETMVTRLRLLDLRQDATLDALGLDDQISTSRPRTVVASL